MSKENLEQFMSKVADSEELQAKIGEQIDAAALIALGAECGCEFTAEELQDSAELSDDELDEVAGGAVIPDATTAPKYGGTNCGAGGAGALGGGWSEYESGILAFNFDPNTGRLCGKPGGTGSPPKPKKGRT